MRRVFALIGFRNFLLLESRTSVLMFTLTILAILESRRYLFEKLDLIHSEASLREIYLTAYAEMRRGLL